MTAIVALAVYIVYALFLVRTSRQILLWRKGLGQYDICTQPVASSRCKIIALTGGDILFLRRALRANPVLWVGEWTFHLSLALVALRHLRYFLDPLPGWLWHLQPLGIFAGYLLPLSISCIFVMRFLNGKEKYRSPENLFILAVILLAALTGVLMHGIFKPAASGIKEFVIAILAFRPVSPPDGILFYAHLFFALLLLPCLPSHIFAAYLVIAEARKRDEGLKTLMHEE